MTDRQRWVSVLRRLREDGGAILLSPSGWHQATRIDVALKPSEEAKRQIYAGITLSDQAILEGAFDTLLNALDRVTDVALEQMDAEQAAMQGGGSCATS